MNKKLTITTLILLASLGLVVSGCLKKEPESNTNTNQDVNVNTNQQAEEIDTSTWETYRNEEYGFEFRYPEGLSVKDWAYKTTNWELLLVIGQNQDIGDGVISIGVEKNMKEFDREKIFWPVPRENILIKEVTIGSNNYKSYEVVVNFNSVDGGVNTINYFIEYSNNLLQIDYNRNKSSELSEEIFREILSTFKFTN